MNADRGEMHSAKSWKNKTTVVLVAAVLTLPAIAPVVLFLVARTESINREDLALGLDLAAFTFALYISLFTGYLSWRALVFAAVPRIEIEYLGDEKSARMDFGPREKCSLRFRLRNVGWWYARPASTNTEFFLAFDPAFSLVRARYGSQLELFEETVRQGKDKSRYLWVKGIHLYYGEPSEEIVVDAVTPEEPRAYDCWISSLSEQTAYGVYRYSVTIEADRRE